MKTLILSGSFLIFFMLSSPAQYCGNSGATMCTPSGTLTTDVFTPNEDIPCLVRGQTIHQTVELNVPTALAGGAVSTQTITIDSITNLPNGLCWASNKVTNSFAGGQSGCISFIGSTNSPPGQYQIHVFVTLVTNVITMHGDLYQLSQQYAIPGNCNLCLRLIDQSFTICPPFDSTQQVPFILFPAAYDSLAVIEGKLFFDINQNNVQDNGEQPLLGELVHIGSNCIGVTNQSGNYSAYPLPGVYDIKPQLSQMFSELTIAPDSLVVHANSATVLHPENNFAIIPAPDYCA